jgi:hypothetical protein
MTLQAVITICIILFYACFCFGIYVFVQSHNPSSRYYDKRKKKGDE